MKQDIYELSAIQRYPIGFKYPSKNPLDLRSFYYGEAAATLNTNYGAKSVVPQLVNFATINAPMAQGDVLLAIDVALTDGALGNGVIGEDELAGGYLTLFTDVMHSYTRMIVANTATNEGIGLSNREVCFMANGGISMIDVANANYSHQAQRAGFVLPNLRDGSEGAPFFFLQITP